MTAHVRYTIAATVNQGGTTLGLREGPIHAEPCINDSP